ncbi:uroporphyrinogen-III synthase [Sulfurospirillum barnesii SES-3]|uniref:Uroporphyrinogen-III synthase n=1 Tax=Sulfurospirillum barnesii (strain ATCC 700032 / DSM 10660 / SES-3) TaxID=760154 RepID=I3XVI4_SULBS|nr:uroporphyrinogen-III synthase [Sulfurospirillum barnesii SES-3]
MGIKSAPIYLFSDQSHEGVEHLPLFEIVFTSSSPRLEEVDAIIFTSKNSVKALELCGVYWQDKACYAIGEGTAAAIRACGGNLLFTCKHSYGDLFAHELIPLLKDKRVFFPRAKEVISPLFEILHSAGVTIFQEIMYETLCRHYAPVYAPAKNAILIFTSPSTVHCFLKNFSWDESYRTIVIGTKTAAVLPLHVKPIIAEVQTIAHCVALAKAL